MKWVIGEVHYSNFGPFEDTVVDFASPGLTLIEGLIEGKVGCDSNGAGKSFLFDGPTWALFGRCIRERYKGDDVIRNGTKFAMVSVSLSRGDTVYEITRYRAHPVHGHEVHVTANGQALTRGTIPETDKMIIDTLGLDYTTFSSTVAFGVREDVKSFFFASDVERKELVGRILGVEAFERAEVLAKKERNKIVTSITEKGVELERITSRVTTLAERLEECTEDDDTQDEVAEVEEEIARLENEEATTKKKLKSAKSKHAKAEAVYDAAYKKYSDAYDAAEAEGTALSAKLTVVGEEISVNESNITRLTHDCTTVSSLEGGKCYTCKQGVPASAVKRIVKLLQTEIAKIVKSQKAAKRKRAEFTEAHHAITFPDCPSDEESASLGFAVTKIESEQDNTDTFLIQSRKQLATLQRVTQSKEAANQKLEEDHAAACEKQTILNGVLGDLRYDLSVYEFWVEGFGSKGVRSFLIENALPAVNKEATYYASRLLGDGAYVRLQATRQLKSSKRTKDELTVEANIPGCADSYAGASKGQRKRLNLSLLLAFRSCMAARSPVSFDQCFVDEIFDGLDAAGSASVLDLLLELAATVPTLLITHDPRIKGVEDRLVMVKHDGVAAHIHDTAAKPRAKKTVKKIAKKIKKKKANA